MKKRSIGLMILFTILTSGIYMLYWYCSFQNSLKRVTGLGFGGFGHLMATLFTFGIYGLVWSYKVGERIDAMGGKGNGGVYLILNLIGLGGIAYLLMQNDANKVA